MPGRVERRPTIALNLDRIGHTYPSYRYEVSREKIREYAEATGVLDAAYHADAADVPLSDILAPPAFAACFCMGRTAQLIADRELGAHWNLVHGSQAFTYHRPIRGGDVYDCTLRIVDIADRGRMELLTYEIACVDAGSNEPVVDASTVIVFFKADEEGA